MVLVSDFGSSSERVLGRSDGVLATLRIVGGWLVPVSWLLLLPRSWRDAAYDLVAARRYRWFGRLDACQLPSQEDRERFLD